MKKMLCFLLCLTLIFSSVSLCFATPTSWDTSDQANLRYIYQTLTSGGNLYTLINNIKTNTQTISNTLTDIKSYLVSDNQSVAYWAQYCKTFLQLINQTLSQLPTDLFNIVGGLGYFDSNSTFHPYLNELNTALTNLRPTSGYSWDQIYHNGHESLFNNLNGQYNIYQVANNGQFTGQVTSWRGGSPLGNIALQLKFINQNQGLVYQYLWNAGLTGYNNSQNALNWGSLTTSSFTPQSTTDGIYKWLSAIQAPVARLSYVLASDERIDAQEKAAANEQAVVDNFIDSSGDGSASPSDIGSVSDLSSGYKQNFGSDASISGIFNIFDSNNMGWFSQETKNQLDTTTTTRLTKGSESETPLLDKQIDEIYDALGVKKP